MTKSLDDRVKENYGFFKRLFHRGYLRQIESQAEEIRILQEAKDTAEASHRSAVTTSTRNKELSELMIKDLKAEIKSMEEDPLRKLGYHIWDDSQCGVLSVDQDNVVVKANENACEYFALEEPAVIGSSLSDLAKGNEFFGQYIALFVEYSKDVARQEKVRFEPNTFNMKKAAFNIMVYQDVSKGDYKGGFVVLSPHVSPGFIEKLVSDWKTTIYVEGAISFDQTLEVYALPLMNLDEGKKSVHIDLNGVELIEVRSIDTLAKGWGVLTKRNTNCVFTNVPIDVAEYLRDGHGLGKKHITKVQYDKEVLSNAENIRRYKAQQSLEQKGDLPLGGGLASGSA